MKSLTLAVCEVERDNLQEAAVFSRVPSVPITDAEKVSLVSVDMDAHGEHRRFEDRLESCSVLFSKNEIRSLH